MLRLQAAESKLAMMEANEEQLRQRHERRVAEKEEENRLIQIMLNKFKVRHCGQIFLLGDANSEHLP